MIFEYRGALFPEYLKHGNACQYVAPIAKKFCVGHGLDVGSGRWPLDGAVPVELRDVFSSHALEHLEDPIAAIEHWKTRLRGGGVLFLYLPHPAMTYWLPQHCRKHRHSWTPEQMAQIVKDLGFVNVIHSERDLAWGFTVVGFKQ
jgi:hypothetical protein